jgi:hypothetical protein
VSSEPRGVMPDIDTRGVPSHECFNCGSRMFRVVAAFEDFDIAMWGLDAECFACGLPATVPCPIDDPELNPEISAF